MVLVPYIDNQNLFNYYYIIQSLPASGFHVSVASIAEIFKCLDHLLVLQIDFVFLLLLLGFPFMLTKMVIFSAVGVKGW